MSNSLTVSASDPNRLRALLSVTPPSSVRAVVSFGIAGGLDPSFQIGQVLIGSEVVAPGSPWTQATGTWNSDASLVAKLQTALAGAGINAAGIRTPVGGSAVRVTSPDPSWRRCRHVTTGG